MSSYFSLLNSALCRCDRGYGGVDCEFSDTACHPNPCLNGGMCQSFRVNGRTDWRCLCPPDYQGQSCEHDYVCECIHGSCSPQSSGCICQPGYRGAFAL